MLAFQKRQCHGVSMVTQEPSIELYKGAQVEHDLHRHPSLAATCARCLAGEPVSYGTTDCLPGSCIYLFTFTATRKPRGLRFWFIFVPRVETKIGTWAFLHAAPPLWDSLLSHS